MRTDKPAIEKYVGIMKRLFLLFSAVTLPALMVCFVFALLKYAAFWIISPVLAVLWFTVYGLYAMHVSMGTVLGMEITDKVIHLRTKRRTYTYDARSGCVAVKATKRKFVATFETQDSRDKFVFYRRVLFAKSFEEQFTPSEIALFYPAVEEMEIP